MTHDVHPGRRSALSKSILNLGIWLQNNSNSRTGNVTRLFKIDANNWLRASVRASGTVNIKCVTTNPRQDLEVSYNQMFCQQHSWGTGRMTYMSQKESSKALTKAIKRFIPELPTTITRDTTIHL